VQEVPQSETTPFYPRSPYGVAKLYGYWIKINYREAYDIFACNGILFNHESPRRGETFVTRKITRAAALIACALQDRLILGNLDSKRDWGFAPEYCEGMWKILQQEKPDDFVLATGETHTVREFTETAFREVGIELEWKGKGVNETGVIKSISEETSFSGTYSIASSQHITIPSKHLKPGDVLVEVSPQYYRPTEVELLIGNPAKAERVLGWKAKTRFDDLVKLMVKTDVEKVLLRGY